MPGDPNDLGDADGDWYWCLDHQQAEKMGELDGMHRMGPYPTREAAEHWRERVAERNAAWDDDE